MSYRNCKRSTKQTHVHFPYNKLLEAYAKLNNASINKTVSDLMLKELKRRVSLLNETEKTLLIQILSDVDNIKEEDLTEDIDLEQVEKVRLF